MKVVNAKEMANLESLAYRDGASASEFMEEAGSGIALVVQDYLEKHQLDRHVILLCGKGNNGGDAYVTGIHLLHLDYDVIAYQVHPLSQSSLLCQQNAKRFIEEGGHIFELNSLEEVAFPAEGVIVDGLFGTGFKGKVEEPYKSLIEFVNATRIPIIAIDIPSGLDGENGNVETVAIVANETAFLGLPKTGFFLDQGWDHVGKPRYVDFGLPQEYIEAAIAEFVMLSDDMVKPLLPVIKRSRHKYEAGHVVAFAGSPGMPGAAVLCSYASLRSGAGIVHLIHPHEMDAELAGSPAELIRIPYAVKNESVIIELLNKANAILIGPGIGKSEESKNRLKKILSFIHDKPIVLDADALNIIAENKEIKIPKNSILTPHKGEMQRLLGMKHKPILNKEFLSKCQEFAEKQQVTLVLKGGPTFIFHPHTPIQANPTGDPGMATAGSGDVLTGILASLLAQNLSPLEAAQLGVYLHGLAGENAAEAKTSYCLTASDIIEYLPEAFLFMHV